MCAGLPAGEPVLVVTFAADAAHLVDVTASTFETIEIPSLRLDIQTEPVDLATAQAHAVHGRYEAVLALPVHALFCDASPSTVSLCLARMLVRGATTLDVSYEPVAFGPEETVYVRASLALLDVGQLTL